jgi:hypothetical protein
MAASLEKVRVGHVSFGHHAEGEYRVSNTGKRAIMGQNLAATNQITAWSQDVESFITSQVPVSECENSGIKNVY